MPVHPVATPIIDYLLPMLVFGIVLSYRLLKKKIKTIN
jgi:hypothetical protein